MQRFGSQKLSQRVLAGFVALAAVAAAVEEWPQWRGPRRDGTAAVEGNSPAWPEKLRLVWKAPAGEGHASPVVAGNRVYQFARQGEREVLIAFDLGSGKQLWTAAYAAPYEMNPAAYAHGKGPKSTPAVAGGRIYTLGMSGVFTAWDTAGKVVWRFESKGKFKDAAPTFGVAASPLVHGPVVLAYIGTDNDGALTAFDVATGTVKWQYKGDGPGYGSPVLAPGNQIIAVSANSIAGVSAADGKQLWKMPFNTPYTQNAVTPLVLGDLLLYSGLQNPVSGYRLTGQNPPAKLWEAREVGMYMSSPVVSGGLVYGLSHRNRGQFFSLDPKSGKIVWTGEARQGENALLIARGDTVLALTTENGLQVFRATNGRLDLLRKYSVSDTPTWAHPAVIDGQVVIKDRDNVSLWSVQ